MPADASIYGQIAQPQSNNLLKNYADVLAIQQGQQTGEMNRMKMADYARTQARQNKLLELSSQFGPDATDDQRISTLKNAGFYDEADKLTTSNLARQKTGAEVTKSNADAEKARMESATKRIDLIGQAFGALRQAPTLENAHGVIDFLQQSGVYSPEQAQAMKAKASSDPSKIAQGADIAFRAALDAKSQLPQILSANTGNAQTTTAIDVVTGKPIAGAGQSLPIMQSPDNAATNATSAANNANTVRASLANASATREVAAATRDAANAQRDQATEMKLADDYRAQSKGFKEVSDAHKQISATLDKATTSPAATLAAATKFMKLLDPGSVVRESELGMALAASGVIDRATNYYNTLKLGRVLTPSQAADFKKITNDLYAASKQQQQAIDANYKGLADRYKLRKENIVQDLGQNTSSPVDFDKMPSGGGKVVDFGSLK